MTTAYASAPQPTPEVYDPRSVRVRRTQAEMRSLRDTLYLGLEAEHPATVRGTFYQAVNAKAIDKSEKGYATVKRLLGLMRREGRLPFSWITDSTRWMRKPQTYSSAEEAIRETARFYRQSLWNDTPTYVEIWCEKDAITGAIYPVTSEFDVLLMICRGNASISFLHSAAEEIAAQGRPTFIYYLGDRDPTGVHIDAKVESELRRYAPNAEIYFERIAVTPEQIRAWNLPTRPTKKTDTRSKTFVGESVELDAIPAALLRALVRDCIERHVDPHKLNTLLVAEESERAYLTQLAAAVRG
jgi:hypothetical protein